jgi:predicted O-methyltransferase YrrM
MPRCATTLEAEMTPAEHALLLDTLRSSGRTGRHLEIGTAAGGTLCAMLGAFGDGQRPPFAVVDPMKYFANQLDAVRKNLRDHGFDPAAIDFRVATSQIAFLDADTRRESFDFMLIDGCHKIRSVMTDLKWTRLLSVGGVACFHDFTPKHRGVWLAVNRFLAKHPNYRIAAQADSLLVVRKTAASSAPEITPADEFYALAWYLPLQLERKWQRLRKAA